MFREVELNRFVQVATKDFDRNGLVPVRAIINRVLENLLREKASKDHGYFLAITGLRSIKRIEVADKLKDVFFRVIFNCRTFMPFNGEVLQGIVHHINRYGVLLKCGPLTRAFLSARKMPNYHYAPGENPVFLSDELAKIEIDVVLRFSVLGVRWVERNGTMKREFAILASLEGDRLGPVSLSGIDVLDL